ncbi:cystathionine gamma-lyase-like [Ptychodera flava]|uniref:cystathionine gamma-lyase-like n=1 Tax=Ptychodera flava TaxID=63121 RepID=UPI003969C465
MDVNGSEAVKFSTARGYGMETLVQHAGQEPKIWSTDSAVIPPIVTSTTFRLPDVAETGDFVYARCGNPTRNSFESCIAALEGAKHGIAFASGVTTLFCVTNMLKSGDHIVSGNELYGGCSDQMKQITSNLNIQTTFVDSRDPKNVAAAMTPNTKMVWIETPSNPGLRISDIAAIAEIAHNNGAFLCVDNTFSSPYFQQPLKLGADLVMSSVTKYINGHTDVLMGIVCTNRDDFNERLRNFQLLIGAVPSPFDCYLANRGVKTLPLRMEKHQENAIAVAKALAENPRVEKVLYPGLPSHPQHELAKKQMSGFSGMVSLWIKGGLKEVKIFFKSLKVVLFAVSLGGTHSLTEHPATLTHDGLTAEEKEDLGVQDNLVRLSVGLETTSDLIADLEQALKAAIPEV